MSCCRGDVAYSRGVPVSKVLLSLIIAAALCVLPAWATQGPRDQKAAGSAARPAAQILFVGSSIFHRWTNLATQMAPLPIVNRAFDGAQTDDMLRGFASFVLPDRPRVIVYYCGSNDVDAGEPAEAIVDRIQQFFGRVATALPDTQMIFVSINRAPEKKARWDVVDLVNRRVEAYAATTPRLKYVDVNPVLFNPDGTPRAELYLPDQLHFRAAAYEEFTRVLKPALTQAFAR
jgi:lysophospholipase L1-like esterase